MNDRNIADSVALLRNHEASSEELVTQALEQIEQSDQAINAYITVTAELAIEQARAADRRIRAGEHVSPLLGVPFSVKDNIDTAGVTTTSGSSILESHKPSYDATVVKRLRSAGAVMVGKTNLHEFAWGGTTDNPHYGASRNPWNLDRTCAGSSGGSAASVAVDSCTFSLGTDTGGSVRAPASATGVSGLRPTFGRVSNAGVLPLAWTMDTVGPLARSVDDLALVLSAIEGPDGVDHTVRPLPHNVGGPAPRTQDLRIGWDQDYAAPHVDASVLCAIKAALRQWESMGATVVPAIVPEPDYIQMTWSVINIAEPSALHQGLFAEHGSKYGSDVAALIELGRDISAVDYLQAQRFRSMLREQALRALADVDVLALPTAAARPGLVGADPLDAVRRHTGHTPGTRLFTALASVLGWPALTIPCGFAEGMPVGIQLMARPFEDHRLLAIGADYQRHTHWHRLQSPYPGHRRESATTERGVA